MISNRTRAARSFDFEITPMISDQIALHSVQISLCIVEREKKWKRFAFQKYHVKLTVMLAGLLELTGLYVNDPPRK